MIRIKDLKEQPMCGITLIVFPQTSNFRIKKLCCNVFEDNEAVIKGCVGCVGRVGCVVCVRRKDSSVDPISLLAEYTVLLLSS